MKVEEVQLKFSRLLKEDPDVSAAIAAMKILIEFIKEDSQSETLAGLRANLTEAIKHIKETDSSVTSVSSGCELFLRFITFASMEHRDFQECKRSLVDRGNLYLKNMQSARIKISNACQRFIKDGSTILTHSRSRVVLQTLLQAANANKRFHVYVTESRPDRSGFELKKRLKEASIPCTVILDSAVGYIMEKIDLVLVGAEGVVESGGIINKIGSYTLAVCAHTMNKPFYVLAESFKFVRLYPLNQQDIPNQFKYPASSLESDLGREHPLVDYTPPVYITLLFTDLGILTPSAISDELINLYL